MCFENFKNSSNDAVSLAPLQVRKGFCLRGHVGYYSKSQVQLTRCLRGAYADLAIVVGNYNQKNRTIKKTHKETIVEGTTGRFQLMKWFHQAKPELEYISYFDLHMPHMCLRTVLTQHILDKTPYATWRQPGFCLRQMLIWQGPN